MSVPRILSSKYKFNAGSRTNLIVITAVTRSLSSPDDHCSQQIQSISIPDDHCRQQIQSVSRSDDHCSQQIQSVSRSDDHCSQQIQSVSRSDDHCSHQIQSVSRSDGGSAPRDDLYSSERQRRPGHLDEPQRQISSEDLVT